MIVISGALVLVALVLLVMGVLGADLPFVYASIAVSALSLLCLLVGILQRRGEPLPDDDGDLVPVEVPTRTSVRVGAAAEAARDENGSSTQTLSHDLLSRGQAHDAAGTQDEERWQADLSEEQHAEDHEHEEDAYEQDEDAYEQDEDPYEQDEDDAEGEDDAEREGVGEEEAVGHGSVRLIRRPREQAELDLVPEPEGELESEEAPEPEEEEPEPEDGTDTGKPGGVVLVVPGRPRYHVEGCRYLYRKQPQDLEVAEAQAGGFLPCGVCRPDEILVEQAPPLHEDDVEATEEFEHEAVLADAEVAEQPDARSDRSSQDAQPAQGEQEAERRPPEETEFEEPVLDGPPAEVDAEQSADDAAAATASDSTDGGELGAGDGPEESVAQRELEHAVDPAVLLEAAHAPEAAAAGQTDAAAAPLARAERAEGSGNRTPAKRAPAKKAPAKKAPAKKAPAKKARGEELPAAEAAAPKAPAAEASRPGVPPQPTPAGAPVRKVRAASTAVARTTRTAPPVAPASAAESAPSTPGVRRVRAVGAAAPSRAGGTPAVRRVSATGAAKPRPPTARASTPAGETEEVVVIPDRARFHRARCRFVQGVPDVTALSRTAAGSQGYEPCGVCKP